MLSALLLALAMQTTNTQCTPLGGSINCTTYAPQPYTPPPPITQFDAGRAIRSWEAGRAARDQREQQAAPERGGGDLTSFQEELAQRMGILSRQGRCEDAFRLAALAGESELADASRRLCPF